MNEETKTTKDMKQCSIDLVRKYPHTVVIVLLIIAFLLGTAVGGAGHRGGDYRGRMDRDGMQRGAYEKDMKGYKKDAEAPMPAPQEALPVTGAQVAPTDMPTPETPAPTTGTGTN